MYLIFTLAFILGLSVLVVEVLRPDRKESAFAYLYKKKEKVLNKSEQAFFYELKKQISNDYYIFPNMRIADILEANHGEGFYGRRNKILPKHIDFLICDQRFKPLIALEVNGSSHYRKERRERDALIKEIFLRADLPLEFVNVGSSFEEEVRRIKEKFSLIEKQT